MEYTQEMYEEDRKLAHYIYCQHFKGFYKYKDDLIAVALKDLYKYRLSYDDSKGKYSTYACKACWWAISFFLRMEYKQSLNLNACSLDTPIKVGSNDTLSDFIQADNSNFNSNLNMAYLNYIVNKILVDKNQTYQKVIRLLMQGYHPKCIAEMIGISRQCACQYRDKFKALLKERLQKDNYLV